MRTNVTGQFRSRERKCLGTKRPGTVSVDANRRAAAAAAAAASRSVV